MSHQGPVTCPLPSSPTWPGLAGGLQPAAFPGEKLSVRPQGPLLCTATIINSWTLDYVLFPPGNVGREEEGQREKLRACTSLLGLPHHPRLGGFINTVASHQSARSGRSEVHMWAGLAPSEVFPPPRILAAVRILVSSYMDRSRSSSGPSQVTLLNTSCLFQDPAFKCVPPEVPG